MAESYDPRLRLDDPTPATPLVGGGHVPELNGHAVAPPDLTGGAGHIKNFVKTLYKRRWLVGATFLAVMVGTTVYTYTRVPIYEAQVKVLIEPDDPFYIDVKDVADQDRRQNDYYQTQYDLLTSRSLARRTAEALKLGSVPPVATARQSTGFRATLRAMMPAFLAGSPEAAPASTASTAIDESASDTRGVNLVLGGLQIDPVRMSRVVDLKYRSADPGLARQIVNAHAKSYIEQTTEFKFMSSKEASDWLGERLSEQRKLVEAAEATLQNYRETEDAMAADERENIVIQKLADMNREVTRAKTTRLSKEAVYEQLRAMETNPSGLDTFPAVLMNPVIQSMQADIAQMQRKRLEMSQNYLDTHPEMETMRKSLDAANVRLRTEIAKVVEGVRNDYLAARAQEQSLEQALAQNKMEALAMNKKAIDYGVLSREVESARSVYQMLLQRAGETGVSTQLRTSNVRIIDFAETPTSPILPRIQSNLMMGFFGGLLAAFALGFLFEYLDSRIKTPEEIRVHLRIPALGLLPLVREKMEEGRPLISQPVSPKFSEALRSVRTNVIFSTTDTTSRSLVITSTGPSEGKTVVSTNLAVGLAEAGQRVLLIDADMRKPKVHSVFALPQEPGLSNLLVGTAKASETVLRSPTHGLWILPAGRLPPNPAELLGSTRFRDFLSSLREHFDWVIIDTPPVMAVTDASVVAHLVSGVVFVVGTEMVSRQAASLALDQLESARGKILGGILNRVDLDRNSFYYSQYYRKEYSEYYTSTLT